MLAIVPQVVVTIFAQLRLHTLHHLAAIETIDRAGKGELRTQVQVLFPKSWPPAATLAGSGGAQHNGIGRHHLFRHDRDDIGGIHYGGFTHGLPRGPVEELPVQLSRDRRYIDRCKTRNVRDEAGGHGLCDASHPILRYQTKDLWIGASFR